MLDFIHRQPKDQQIALIRHAHYYILVLVFLALLFNGILQTDSKNDHHKVNN